MKRKIVIVLMLVLWLSVNAYADVIWEPDDDFYRANSGYCTYVNRSYTANGPGGAVTVYKSPENPTVTASVANGETMYISYTYEAVDGNTWGCYESWETGDMGWIPMAYAVEIYNYQNFEEEFGHRFTHLSEWKNLDGWKGQQIWIWGYPGKETGVQLVLDVENTPSYDVTFTDDAGRTWGFCSYFMADRNFWFCLDDPTADYETLYDSAPPQQVSHPEILPQEEEIKPNSSLLWLVGIGVAAVAAVSAGSLLALRKKEQSK